jgi:hephaestin
MQTRARVASTLLLAAVAAAAASVAAAALAPAAAGHALDAGPAAQPDLRLTGRRLLAQQQGGGQAGPQPDWLLSTGPAYYVAADFVDWNYAPSGLNLCSNEELTGGRRRKGRSKMRMQEAAVQSLAAAPGLASHLLGSTPLPVLPCPGCDAGDAAVWGADGLGVAFKKAQFREYTDRSFSKLKPRPASEAHTGLLGPVLRAAVGQVVTLVLRNNLNFSVNLEPAGVRADVAEGEAPDAAAALAPAVPPGGIFTYYWRIPASMGPGPLEPSAKLWLYRSTVDPVGHATAGLLGPMLIRC